MEDNKGLQNDTNNIKFDWDDIVIVPEVKTTIKSRETCKYTNVLGKLPLFSSPMDSLFSLEDVKVSYKKTFNKKFYNLLDDNRMMICTPRKYKNKTNFDTFKSVSLSELKEIIYKKQYDKSENRYICVDTANGHLIDILYNVRRLKDLNNNIIVMVGNIANPETIIEYDKYGVDYCRVGIGNGSGCLTSQQTAVSYPMGSLIYETYQQKIRHNLDIKIVADGGFKKYSDIIKGLVLGADYVMIGGLLSKTLESDNYPYLYKKIKINNLTLAKWLFKNKFPLYKKFKGMSTKEVQKLWGNEKLKTSEGIVKWDKVEYTFEGWLDNFKSYLTSAMSYTNSTTLEDFRNSKWVLISENSLNRFKK